MRYGLLPSQYITDRLRRDTGIRDFNLDPDDQRDWLAEGIRGAQLRGQFSERRVQLTFDNHRCPLPTDWAGYTWTNHNFTRHYDVLYFQARQGVATIDYLVMPVDSENMPMLIDHPRFLDYMFWFVAEKLAWKNLLPPAFTTQACLLQKLDHLRSAEIDMNWPTSQSSARLPTNS